MERILQHLRLKDRIRLCIVCKSWKSTVMRRDIRCAPHEPPWLILHPQLKDPNCSSNNYLSFLSLSDAKIHNLRLPTPPEGAMNWIHGSTKSWLIMIRDFGLDCEMFLLNPISRVPHKLPSFSKIGDYFKRKIETEGKQRSAALDFLNNIELSTSDVNSEHCLVAAVFKDHSTLAMCRPGDENWIILLEVPDFEAENYFRDILFSSDVLHACRVHRAPKDKETSVEARTLNFGDQVVELKLVHFHFFNSRRGKYIPRLLESNNEVLLVIQRVEELGDGEIGDYGYHGDGNDHNDNEGDEANADVEDDNEYVNNLEGNDQDEEFYNDVEEHPKLQLVWRTCCFQVYKLNPKNDIFLRVKCLVDKILLLADRGYLSVSTMDNKELEANRNYFALKTCVRWKPPSEPVYCCHDIGVFNLESGRTDQQNFPSIDMSMWSRLEGLLEKDIMRFSWFIPSM